MQTNKMNQSEDFILIVIENESENTETSSLLSQGIEDNFTLRAENCNGNESPFNITVKVENIQDTSLPEDQNMCNKLLDFDSVYVKEEHSFKEDKEYQEQENCSLGTNDENTFIQESNSPTNLNDLELVKELSNTVNSPKAEDNSVCNDLVDSMYMTEHSNTEYLEQKLDEECSLGTNNENFTIQRKSKSYVSDLLLQFPELRQDKEVLIEVLAWIMGEVKVPPLPENYYKLYNSKFKCPVCSSLTDTLPAAGRHYQEKHGPRYLVCFACGADFRSRGILYKHEKNCKRKHSKIVLKARAMFLGGKAKNRPFICKNRTFMCNNRPLKVKKMFYCAKCPAAFVSKQALESHVNKHEGNRPYHCDICANAYTSRRGLQRHFQKHSNPQYICDICKRNVKTKATLIQHLTTHLPLKQFSCSECDRRYANKYALGAHFNKVHKNLPHPYGCKICPCRYPRMGKLKEHMEKKHGLSIMTQTMFIQKLPTLSDSEIVKAKAIMVPNSTLIDGHPITIDD